MSAYFRQLSRLFPQIERQTGFFSASGAGDT